MKKKDQLTPFLIRELLFDYVKGKLDPDRAERVSRMVEENPELKLELRNLKEKVERLSAFDQTRPSKEWMELLSLPHPSLTQQLVSIERRWVPRFWKTLPPLTLVLSVSFAALLFKPWQLFNVSDVEVAQVQLNDDEMHLEAALALSEKDIEEAMKGQAAEEETDLSSEASKAEGSGSKITLVDATQTEKSQAPSKPAKEPQKPQVGELYRAFIAVDELNTVTTSTVEKVLSLGGRKAGQVQLGWERDEEERYFHFSLPEKNKESLLSFLSNFGQVRLSRQDHPLVMPQGKIRIILVVKRNSQSPKAEESPALEEETSQSGTEESTP